jgi:hypothetical protein
MVIGYSPHEMPFPRPVLPAPHLVCRIRGTDIHRIGVPDGAEAVGPDAPTALPAVAAVRDAALARRVGYEGRKK